MPEAKTPNRVLLSPEREAELADLAESVVETHCGAGAVDPETIIRNKKIALCVDHYEDAFDGMLEYEDGRFFIHCNLDRENHPESPRGRFTLAHELGHYFIDEHRNNLASGQVPPHPSCSDRPTADLLIEREADFFASRLLLPGSRFRRFAKQAQTGLAGIKTAAESFNVSLMCAALRFVSAEVFPSVLIKWSNEGFCWRWCSRSFWDFGYRRTIQAIDKIPRDSATATCFAGSAAAGTIFESATTAAFVFPAVGARTFQNIVLREEAISLGRFGVLSVFTLRQPFPREVVMARKRELGFA